MTDEIRPRVDENGAWCSQKCPQRKYKDMPQCVLTGVFIAFSSECLPWHRRMLAAAREVVANMQYANNLNGRVWWTRSNSIENLRALVKGGGDV